MFNNAVLLILLFAIPVVSQTPTPEPPNESEFNIWTDASVTIPIKKGEDKKGKSFDKVNLYFGTTQRFGRDNLRFIDERAIVGMNFRVNKYVTLNPEIFYQAQQPTALNKNTQTRFRFAVKLSKGFDKVSISNKSQIEYRMINSRKDDVRLKNKFRFNVPIKKDGKTAVTLFASEEPYYNINSSKFTRNEIFLGASKKFNKNFTAEAYYLLMNDLGFPKTVNGLGLNFKFRVD